MKRKQLLERAVEAAASNSGRVVRVWATTREECKALTREVAALCIPKRVSLTNRTITLFNDSEIRFADSNRAPIFRGEATVLEIVLLPAWVEEVARPCLFDHGGDLLVETE